MPIGQGCEEFSSLVYQLAAERDATLAYTKRELGLYSGGVFDIELTDPKPFAAKTFKAAHADNEFSRGEVD